MSKIKVINLKAFIEEVTEGKYTAHGQSTLGIIEGPKGIIVSHDDGYHTVANSLDEEIQIPVKLNDDQIKLMPEGMGDETISKLLGHESTVEKSLDEYIEHFGSRIESNVKLLKKSIEDVGLNPDEFE